MPSVLELLDGGYDLVILDLGGVANDLSKDDGYGVLDKIKKSEPFLPVLVVTGGTTPPDKINIANKADLFRSKPVLPAELSEDVELILKYRKNEFWAGLEVLMEVNRLNEEIQKNISLLDRVFLYFHRKSIANKIINEEKDIVAKVIKVAKITSKLGKVALKINKLSSGIG